MSEEEIRQKAKSLAESVTASAIAGWLQGWIDMKEDHPQYSMRYEQIKIGKMALEEV